VVYFGTDLIIPGSQFVQPQTVIWLMNEELEKSERNQSKSNRQKPIILPFTLKFAKNHEVTSAKPVS